MSTPARSRPGGHAVGLPAGVYLGNIPRRFIAFVVDLVPVCVLLGAGVVAGSAGPWWLGLLVELIGLGWLLLLWWMLAVRAATVGMRLARIQLVGMHDGRPVGWLRALLRGVITGVLTSTVAGMIILAIMMLRHQRRQGWHDRAVDAVVIEERSLAPRMPAREERAPMATGPGADPQQISSAPPYPALPEAGPEVYGPASSRTDDHGFHQEIPSPPSSQPTVEQQAPGPVEPVDPVVHPASSPPEQSPLNQRWSATFDDGRVINIQHVILVGRNPRPRPGEDGAELIKITDGTRTISKTHLALSVDGHGVIVTDRGSTNGTAVIDPDGVYQLLTAVSPMRISMPGCLVAFGRHHLRIGQE